jgi:hypothetical protein
MLTDRMAVDNIQSIYAIHSARGLSMYNQSDLSVHLTIAVCQLTLFLEKE